MTPLVYRRLAQVQLGLLPTIIFKAASQPPNLEVVCNSVVICNTDTVQRRVTIRLGEGVLTAANSILDAAVISPNTTYFLFDNAPFTLKVDTKLEGFADLADKVTVTLFGNIWTG
jgi:hypothetical protein